MSISDYAENKLLDAIANASTTGGGLPTADPWVKLHTGAHGPRAMNHGGRTTTQRELERLVRKWQPRLGLRDWTIEIELVRYYRHDAESYGSVDFFAPKRTAKIKVIHPRDQHPDDMNVRLGHFDPEVVVVHELLHVVTWSWSAPKHGSAKDTAREQAIHQLSLALLGR